MGADASGATEDQTTCDYNEKQHNECKKTVATYEDMINNYNQLIEAAEKDAEALNYKITELESELANTTTLNTEQVEKIKLLENTVKDYDKKLAQIKDLEKKLSDMTSKYNTANTNYNNEKKKSSDMTSKYNTANTNYNKLNDRIKRLKGVCTGGNTSKCNTSKVYQILNEKFTSAGDHPCSVIIYCTIALLVGILIGAWLFGVNKRYTQKNDVKSITVNEDTANIDYIPEKPEE